MRGEEQRFSACAEEAALSLSEMAKRLDWDKGRLSKYENNQLGISLSVAEEIAKVLKKRPETVVLLCLKEHYPKLKKSETGEILDALVNALEQ